MVDLSPLFKRTFSWLKYYSLDVSLVLRLTEDTLNKPQQITQSKDRRRHLEAGVGKMDGAQTFCSA
jgi:hypothetical protein